MSVRVNWFTTYASTMQTYFIQAKKFNLVESSICTQSIINTNSLKILIFLLSRTHRYNSYTFRIGVSVLYLIYMSFDEKLNKFRHLILSKSSLQILQITNLLFHIVPLDRSVTFIDLVWTSSFGDRNRKFRVRGFSFVTYVHRLTCKVLVGCRAAVGVLVVYPRCRCQTRSAWVGLRRLQMQQTGK